MIEYIIRECEICQEKRYFRYLSSSGGVPWRAKDLYACEDCSHIIELNPDELTEDDRRNCRR